MPTSKRLTGLAAVVALLAATPLFYIGIRAFGADRALWARLWSAQIPSLLLNTFELIIAAVGLSTFIGVGLAWLVERSALPHRDTWRWVFALPLAVPAYISAVTYLIVFRRGGWLDQAFIHFLGYGQGQAPLPNIYSVGGATLAISLCVYPYVYLPVAATLRGMNRSLEEAARMAGHRSISVFVRVTLPILLPSIGAGALLVAMYVLSDFGTVSMLRFRTFTTAIFAQIASQVDRAAASALSMVLIGIALILLMAESHLAQRNRQLSGGGQWRPTQANRHQRRRAIGIAILMLLLSLGLPVMVLGTLSVQAVLFPTEVDRIWSVGSESIWQHSLNSLLLSAAAATLATGLALAPSYLAVRSTQPASRVILALSKTAYALPGVIVGLAFVMLLNQYVPLIYGTVAGLLVGFVFRLMPQSVATSEPALRAVPPRLEQAARVMGTPASQSFWRVTLPIAMPGLIASWTLVFISSMKELPTALMLRPPGFDTLPVRVWAAASESVYTQAALPAFLLIALTALPLALVHRHSSRSFLSQ